MHKRLLLLGLLAAAVIAGAGANTAQAQPPVRHSLYQHYIDPFTAEGWYPARTDMGVDWVPVKVEPVKAIGDAVILGSDRHSGWPGGRLIWYQLLNGSHAGDIVYVAENLRHLIAAGTHVRAGQTIADALPAYPWTEWGWADQYGSPIAYPCYHEGQQTRAGKRMARFMRALGASPYDNPGAGPDTPLGGPLC